MPLLSSTCGGLGALWAHCYGAFHPKIVALCHLCYG